MKRLNTLKLLGDLSKFDVCGYPRAYVTHKQSERFPFVYHAMGENGGSTTRLFKVLLTNQCEGNCYYCANRKERNTLRAAFTPKDLAELFMSYHAEGLTEGFFLSSGIHKNADSTQEEIIETLQILRKKCNFTGYVHTKILPGTSDELIYKTAEYSDRISINIEGVDEKSLTRLSPDKSFKTLKKKLAKLREVAERKHLKSGVTTQFVVGAGKETDKEILTLANELYKDYKLRRVYYSGFIPVDDTPLENLTICPPERELRLYQADFLMRSYNFTPAELPYDKKGLLPMDKDPKLAWAEIHKDLFPIELNTAGFNELMKVPGIGKISASRIIKSRETDAICTLDVLKKFGANVSKARNFVTLKGRFLPAEIQSKKGSHQKQLFLWEEL